MHWTCINNSASALDLNNFSCNKSLRVNWLITITFSLLIYIYYIIFSNIWQIKHISTHLDYKQRYELWNCLLTPKYLTLFEHKKNRKEASYKLLPVFSHTDISKFVHLLLVRCVLKRLRGIVMFHRLDTHTNFLNFTQSFLSIVLIYRRTVNWNDKNITGCSLLKTIIHRMISYSRKNINIELSTLCDSWGNASIICAVKINY